MQTTRRCPEASPTLDGMTLRHKMIIVWEGGFSEMQVISLPYKLWARCFPSEAKCKQCWPRRERAESHLHGVHITDEFHAGISKQAEEKISSFEACDSHTYSRVRGVRCSLTQWLTLPRWNALHRWVWKDGKCRNLEGRVTVTTFLLPDKFVLYTHH